MNFSEEMARLDDEWRTRRRRIDSLVSDSCLTNGAFLTGYKIAYYHALAHDSAEFQASYQKSMEAMMYLHSRVCMQAQAIAELHLHRDHSDPATWQAYPCAAAPLIRDLKNLIEQLRVHAAALRPQVPKKHQPSMDEPFERFSTLALSLVEALAESSAFAGEIEYLQTRVEPIEKAVKTGYKQTEVGVIPEEWECTRMSEIAKLESGHTPSKRQPSYWGGSIPWVSLFDTEGLQGREIFETAKMVTEEGLKNSSARLLPKGTVVFSRTATVGKTTVMGRDMATSQDFANYICGPKLHNHFLVYLFRSMGRTWKGLMAGSIHNTIYMPVFKALQIVRPPLPEQRAIATALSDVDGLLGGLDRLIAKKSDLKQAAMQQLLTGQIRLSGFHGKWKVKRLGDVGSTYGGLTGKTKTDFGEGPARYITFMNVMSNVVIDCGTFEQVQIAPTESQNRAKKGDLFFNGSSETPEEVAMCSVLLDDVRDVYLNSFCFGFRFHDGVEADGLFLAYYFRSKEGRELMKSLAQGSTRYNLSKVALLKSPLCLPTLPEQTAIAEVLTEMDGELAVLEQRQEKTHALKQAMMQELLTGRTRLI
ncbi:MAG: restriction endonuclease subunit S [Prosthecobacter sp.]|uniref:restriction endonuclease subunit S n=1 Tax=Prosthecobacter sp. TaxID=1965333 RepID=UPI0025DC3C49|nr:restriction endonuclease subunit S [Prosthecobacter sp.]MCF7787146.1 restriction endonuclease subunit S [Prosthecobacter sp.]